MLHQGYDELNKYMDLMFNMTQTEEINFNSERKLQETKSSILKQCVSNKTGLISMDYRETSENWNLGKPKSRGKPK